jgi:perosamine synthetase
MTGKSESVEVPFHRSCVDEEGIQAVTEVLRSGWLTMGPKTLEFENEFARYVGASRAVAVSSCTAALHLALEAIGLRPGDEVLVPTTTFTATAEVVTYMRGRPVLVEVEPKTLNIDLADAARRLTPRTRAIIPVHIAGQPCDMEELHSLAREHKLHVIEDAAHALPSEYRGARVGSLSELTAFSFYATKTLATGEGGMITTNNEDYAARIRMMRLHGIAGDAWKRYGKSGSWYYQVMEAGYKYNLTDVQAALGLVQLSKCDAMDEARGRIAEKYTAAFRRVSALEPPTVKSDRKTSWHLYILRLRLERLGIDRDRFVDELRQHGIGTSDHFIQLHLHPFYQREYAYKRGDFPKAEAEYLRCLSLPIYPTMSNAEVEHVISPVTAVASRGKARAGLFPLCATMSNQDVDDVLLGSAAGELSEKADPLKHISPLGQAVRTSSTALQRTFEVVCAATVLVLLSPLLALIGLAIKLEDGGPIFYSHPRVGKDFRRFGLFKFRSMVLDAEHMGSPLTVAGDPRVTRVGCFLRKHKLDEFPQLFNVLRGDIGLVGPRPESECYVAMFQSQYTPILLHRPGITDPATLAYRDEESLLQGADAQRLYTEKILPRKLELSLEYLQRRTFVSDLAIIARTLDRILWYRQR